LALVEQLVDASDSKRPAGAAHDAERLEFVFDLAEFEPASAHVTNDENHSSLTLIRFQAKSIR
jgi:hypothetical protein